VEGQLGFRAVRRKLNYRRRSETELDCTWRLAKRVTLDRYRAVRMDIERPIGDKGRGRFECNAINKICVASCASDSVRVGEAKVNLLCAGNCDREMKLRETGCTRRRKRSRGNCLQ